jgi:hypothetical protein
MLSEIVGPSYGMLVGDVGLSGVTSFDDNQAQTSGCLPQNRQGSGHG